MSASSLAEMIAVECAVLEELARELAAEGMDEHARRIQLAVLESERIEDPVERVRHLASGLRPVDYALEEAGMPVFRGLRNVRRKLSHEADKLLDDTKPLCTGEFIAVDHDD